MALPSLNSELVCLQNLQEILQKRLDLEREYTSSLAAWHTTARKTGPQSTHALRVLFLSLVEAAENDTQARHSMEATLRTQTDRVLAAMKELGGHLERITACSEKLEEFDGLAREALENRKLRYEEWKTWRPKPAPSTGVRLRSKARKGPVLTESTLVTAYNLADRAVRQYVSKAEVARCSFKDKVMAHVDAISVAYQVVIDAITKCLRLFAEDQQECASHTSAGACRTVKVASVTFGFRLAGAFQETLVSEAQDISTYSISYDDLLESDSPYPTIDSQPIIFGFSLPPYYFSYTASTKRVVDVFCQLVSFVCDRQSWDHYATQPPPSDYSLVPIFSELERSWTRDENLNQNLLRSLGPSTCAQLVKALLVSFPEPLIDCSEHPAEHLRLWNPDFVHRPDATWAVPNGEDGGTAPVPFVPCLYNRPQGDMLRAFCVSLIPVFSGVSEFTQNRTCEIFSDLLTRKGECLKYAIPDLVRGFRTTITSINNAPQGSLDSLRKTTLRQSAFGFFGHTRQPYGPSNTSNIESRRNTIINMAKNKANAPHTILLVGGTGVGKSSLVKFIAKTLFNRSGDYYDLTSLNRINERGLWGSGTQTVSPHLYEIASGHHVLIRILDTPGFTGTQHDELLKQSIAMSVEKYLDSVTAVVIHANRTVFTSERMGDALSTLSTILPKTLANNIAFVFTNVSTPSPQYFSVPEVFKGVPTFVFDDPVVLTEGHMHRQYHLDRVDGLVDISSQDEESLEASEQSPLGMLADLFNWMDSLDPQPGSEIVYLFEKYQNIKVTVHTLTQMRHTTAKKAEIDKLMTTLKANSADMDAFSNFEKTADMDVLKQQPMTTRKIDKQVLIDQDMKKKWETAKDEKEKTAALIAVNEMVLHDLKQAVSRASSNLAPLLEQHAYLSLTGSLSVQMERTVKSLERKYTVMRRTGASQDKMKKVKRSLGQMKRELELLYYTEEIRRQESVAIETHV